MSPKIYDVNTKMAKTAGKKCQQSKSLTIKVCNPLIDLHLLRGRRKKERKKNAEKRALDIIDVYWGAKK